MHNLSENRLVRFSETTKPPEQQIQQPQTPEQQAQEAQNKAATINTPDRHRESLQKILESSFNLPSSITIGRVAEGAQPRGPNAFAGIWYNGNYVGTLISNANTFNNPEEIDGQLKDMFNQKNITLDYYSQNITPEAQRRMDVDRIHIVREPGQHVLMIGNRRFAEINYRTPSITARLDGQNLVIDVHTVGTNGDRLTFAPGSREPTFGTLPPTPSRMEQQNIQKNKKAQEEQTEKNNNEQKMDQELEGMP